MGQEATGRCGGTTGKGGGALHKATAGHRSRGLTGLDTVQTASPKLGAARASQQQSPGDRAWPVHWKQLILSGSTHMNICSAGRRPGPAGVVRRGTRALQFGKSKQPVLRVGSQSLQLRPNFVASSGSQQGPVIRKTFSPLA